MKMETNTALRVVMTLSACAAMGVGVVGCGGSSGGGGIADPTKNEVEITAENAPEVAAAAYEFLEDDLTGFVPMAASAVDSRGLGDGSVLAKVRDSKPLQAAKRAAMGARGVASASEKVDCGLGGSVEYSETETSFTVKFNNCKEGYEYPDWSWQSTIDGQVKVTELNPGEYDEAERYEFNVKGSYEERDSDGSVEKGSYAMEGRMDDYYNWSDDAFKLANASFRMQGSGSYEGETWNGTFGVADYQYVYDGISKHEFSGTVGYQGDEGLNGAFKLETVDYLYDCAYYASLPCGEALRISGKGGSELLLTFNADGQAVTVKVNGETVDTFSPAAFYDWLDN